MGTTKSRKTRRNTSRPTAIDFLTNIPLGNSSTTTTPTEPTSTTTKDPLQYPFQSIYHSTTTNNTLQYNNNNNNNDILNYTTFPDNSLEDDGEPSVIAALSLHSSDSVSTDDEHIPSASPFEHSHSLSFTSSFMTPGQFDHVNTSSGKKKYNNNYNYNNTNNNNNNNNNYNNQEYQTYYQHQRRRSSGDSSSHEHHKLTREDSERPIASEKIKKKSTAGERDYNQSGTSIMSVFKYYADKIRQSTSKKKLDKPSSQLGYVQQIHLASQNHHRRRVGLSYAHFLSPIGTLLDDDVTLHDDSTNENNNNNNYDPYFLDNDTYAQYIGNISSSMNSTTQNVRPADARKELNEQFRSVHPEIPLEITLTKIRAIKSHLLEIGKTLDLEISTLAHAYVYFEKLVIKNVITKKNRKLIASCCLFLAFKINEAKGTHCQPLLEAIDDEFDIDSKEVHEHEFAVYADLEFNLYIPRREFMPHFEQIFTHLENKSIESYLGNTHFYQVQQQT
ncbi:unnamed protein product [Cunninghamella echinulata]